MNHLIEEYLIEEHRRDIQREIKQIHMERETFRGKIYRPNMFTRSMEKFGQWLIARGEKLVKRYQTPGKNCKPAKHSYAH